MMSKRQQHAAEFKTMALEARKGKATVSELASRSGVYPTMINERKRPLRNVVCGIFERGSRRAPVIDEHQVRDLQPGSESGWSPTLFWKESPGTGSEAWQD